MKKIQKRSKQDRGKGREERQERNGKEKHIEEVTANGREDRPTGRRGSKK